MIREYANISFQIYSYSVPVVEVYCEEGYVISKMNTDGLAAYKYDADLKSFSYSKKYSVSAP